MPNLRYAVAVAALATGLTACAYQFDERNFRYVGGDTAWGAMFVNVSSAGHWKERGVHMAGSPYNLHFAPRVNTAPAADCKLVVRGLTITRVAGGQPLFSHETLELAAKPPPPRETNYQPHSAHFSYVPLAGEYMATASLMAIDLPYEPLRMSFDLEGGPSCPEGLRGRQRYEYEIKMAPLKGTGYLPSV